MVLARADLDEGSGQEVRRQLTMNRQGSDMVATAFDERLAEFEQQARNKGLYWMPGVIIDCLRIEEGRSVACDPPHLTDLPRVQLLVLANGREYQHVPPPPIVAQMMRYYHVDTAEDLIGRAVWLLGKHGRAYKLYGARELEL